MTLFVALSLGLSACGVTERTVQLSTPAVPATLFVCGDENSPTKDGIPAPPPMPYDNKAVAAYIVKLKAIIRECHGNNNAVHKLLTEFEAKAVEMAKTKSEAGK